MSNVEQTLSIIKPDAVERNLQEEIKNEFKKNSFLILKEKKYTYLNQKLNNFIRFIKQNHFIMTYVLIYLQDQL